MGRVLRDRLQQSAPIGVDRRALQMDAIRRVERLIAALAALGRDDGIGQFELTHFQKIAERTAAANSGRAARPKAKPEPSARHETAVTQGTPISVVMSSSHVRRGTAAPCRSCPDDSAAARSRHRAAEDSLAATPAWRSGAAPDMAARHHDGYRRALRHGRLVPGGRAGFAFGLAARPELAAAARSAKSWKCVSSNWPMPSSRPSAASAAMRRSTRRIASSQRAAIDANRCRLLQPVAGDAAHLPLRATEARDIFGLIVQRLRNWEIETFCLI